MKLIENKETGSIELFEGKKLIQYKSIKWGKKDLNKEKTELSEITVDGKHYKNVKYEHIGTEKFNMSEDEAELKEIKERTVDRQQVGKGGHRIVQSYDKNVY